MLVVLIIITAIIVALNLAFNSRKQMIRPSARAAEDKELVAIAQKHTILYVYAGISGIAAVGRVLVTFIFIHPWTHNMANQSRWITPQFLQVSIVLGAVITLIPLLYLITSRNMRYVINVLKVLLVLQVLGALFAISTLSFGLVVDILQAGLTFAVLSNISTQKNHL